MRPCFKFKASADTDTSATLSIYDEIGFWGVQASDFRTALGAVTAKTVNVEINSPGGDVFAGLAIYNMLKSSGKEIVVKVMGVAASAASLIAMAGDKIIMPKNTFMMVHNPWSFAMGNADELRDTADTLDKIGASLLNTYVAKTGMAEEDMKALLAKDTWLTAEESLEKGFATEVIDDIKATAKFDMERADLPENVRAAMMLSAAPAPDVVEAARVAAEAVAKAKNPLWDQISALATDAGFAEHAGEWGAACTSIEDAQARIATATEIKSFCAFCKMPNLTASLITTNATIVEARAAVNKAKVEQDDKTVVDSTPPVKGKPVTSVKSAERLTTAALWATVHNQSNKKGN